MIYGIELKRSSGCAISKFLRSLTAVTAVTSFINRKKNNNVFHRNPTDLTLTRFEMEVTLNESLQIP